VLIWSQKAGAITKKALISKEQTHFHVTTNRRVCGGSPMIRGTRTSIADALHLACAEKGQADVLLTTDDSLIRLAGDIKKRLLLQVENPLKWSIEEMIR
jgi:predicted nucleic acid-binding protein